MDKDEKLIVFLDSLGQGADVDFAKGILEAHDWNLEAALNIVAGGDASAPSADAHRDVATSGGGFPDVDEDGVRAPMRTGYRDQLLGPSPEEQELMWEQAALQAGTRGDHHDAAAFDPTHGGGGGRSHSRHRDDVRSAMQASQLEYQRMAEQQEQARIAEALQASYTAYNDTEQQRAQRSFQNESEEQRLIAEAIEASYREQNDADALYRKQMEQALAASQAQDAANAALPGSPARSGVPYADSLTGQLGSAPSSRPSSGAAGRMPASSSRPFSDAVGREPAGSANALLAPASGTRRSERLPHAAAPTPAATASSSAAKKQQRSVVEGARIEPAGLAGRRSPMEPLVGQPRHAAEVKDRPSVLTGSAAASASRQSRLDRASSGSGGSMAQARPTASLGGEVEPRQRRGVPFSSVDDPEALGAPAVKDRLPVPQRSAAASRPGDLPGSRGSGMRDIESSRAPAAAPGPVRLERRDPASALHGAGLGAAARAQGVAERPAAPGMPIPTAPRPPSAGSRSAAGTPPNMSVRRGPEDDLVPKATREPRNGLTPLNPSRVVGNVAPGQSAAAREAQEADRRRRDDDERQKRESREADLRKREAARETEEQRRREAEAQEQRVRQENLQRRRREQEAAEAERQRAAAAQANAEAAAAEAEQRRRKAEADAAAAENAKRARREAEATELARQQKEAEAAKRREAAEAQAAQIAEAERRRKEAEAEAEARRREAREAEELQRERAEAEARQREAEKAAQPEEKEKEANEVVTALVALRKRYKEDPEGLATCLRTLATYIRNLANNPHELKYQRINTENAAFHKRVGAFEGSIAVLLACGFQQDGNSLVVGDEFLKSKGPRLFDAVAKIDVLADQLKR